jgi:hypothetical protein
MVLLDSTLDTNYFDNIDLGLYFRSKNTDTPIVMG